MCSSDLLDYVYCCGLDFLISELNCKTISEDASFAFGYSYDGDFDNYHQYGDGGLDGIFATRSRDGFLGSFCFQCRNERNQLSC